MFLSPICIFVNDSEREREKTEKESVNIRCNVLFVNWWGPAGRWERVQRRMLKTPILQLCTPQQLLLCSYFNSSKSDSVTKAVDMQLHWSYLTEAGPAGKAYTLSPYWDQSHASYGRSAVIRSPIVTSFFFLEATSTLPAVSHITMTVKIIPRHRTVNMFPDYQNHSCYTRQLKSHKQIEHVYSAVHLYHIANLTHPTHTPISGKWRSRDLTEINSCPTHLSVLPHHIEDRQGQCGVTELFVEIYTLLCTCTTLPTSHTPPTPRYQGNGDPEIWFVAIPSYTRDMGGMRRARQKYIFLSHTDLSVSPHHIEDRQGQCGVTELC
eukprot:sb/3466789/